MTNCQPGTPIPNPMQISAARLSLGVDFYAAPIDISGLLKENWVDHVNLRDYRGGWDVLPLRCQEQYLNGNPVLQSFAIAENEEWEDLPILKSLPSISVLLNHLHCPLKAVRLMRLKVGAEIKPHRDHGLSMEHGEARLHLPIQTSDDILFLVNQQPVPMRAGELWYINANQEHAVYNRGADDRINLVIDCVANSWLCEKIIAGYQFGSTSVYD